MTTRHVSIYRIEGTQQYIVKAGRHEYSFVRLEDAERFARDLFPGEAQLTIQHIPSGQKWASLAPSSPSLHPGVQNPMAKRSTGWSGL